MIKDVLQDPVVLTENMYNINKTGVMLFIPGFIKILVNMICEIIEVHESSVLL